MTHVLITIDTELSSSRQGKAMPLEANYRCSFSGQVDERFYGVNWLMETMSRHGIRGVFMVDPMPGLVHGPEIVERMVHPILQAGHDVQLHIHTEWLNWAKDSPVEGRQGKNVADFSLPDQIALLGWARDALIQAGAPQPNAFRAGNFGANDTTLEALSHLGIAWDSSFNGDYADGRCQISLPHDIVAPVKIGSVNEAPVATIYDRPGHLRPAQICALSATEMAQGMVHAARHNAPAFVIVTHSFEMLSRDRTRPNLAVMKRCETLCETIERHPLLTAATFADLAQPSASSASLQDARLPPSRWRTGMRLAEQAFANWRYEGKLTAV